MLISTDNLIGKCILMQQPERKSGKFEYSASVFFISISKSLINELCRGRVDYANASDRYFGGKLPHFIFQTEFNLEQVSRNLKKVKKFEYLSGIFTGERRSAVAKPQTSGDSAIIRPEPNDLCWNINISSYLSFKYYLFFR